MHALSCLLLLAAAADPKDAGTAVFEPGKVHAIHLTLDPKEFAAMQPKAGGFNPQAPGVMPDPPWVKGDLKMLDKEYKDVGVRYKGNFTLTASRGLKKSIKFDLDRHVADQALDGLKKFNLNCGVTDPSQTREALSYAFFRAAGVPAPRTAYAELTLTIPGRYDKELVGFYTVVEQIDKGFLARHFKNGKGMLLKPEGLQGGVRFLGEDWAAYESRYVPKDPPTDAQKKRLIDFARLIDRADDATFRKDVAGYLDVDAFLRFVAANALLSNLDSYLAFGHNYYLYLVPGTDRFVFIPWDCDLSLAAWPAAGQPEQQVDLSLNKPWTGTNRLLERLLADAEVKARYRKILEELAAGPFTKANLLAMLEPLEKAVKEPIAREKVAVAGRREGGGGFGGFGGMGGAVFGASLPPRAFIDRRVESVTAQLAGKRDGYVAAAFGFGPPGGGPGPGGPGFAFPRVGELLPTATQDRMRLTPEQRRQLAELQKEADERVEKLLTEEQRATLRRMRQPVPGFGPPPP